MIENRVTIILLLVIFGLFGLNKGGSEMAIDKSIVDIVECLNCPVLYSDVSESEYAPYSIIQEAGIKLFQSWPMEDKTVEMYKGKANGYLGILRKDDKVFCAQYLNNAYGCDYSDRAAIPGGVYYYTFETSASGIYVKTEMAFFTDGQVYSRIFRSPNDTKPFSTLLNTDESMLSYCID